MKRNLAVWALIFLLLFPPSLFAVGSASDTGRFTSGFTRVLLAAFQLPLQIVGGTLNGPPLLGTVGGALTGTIRTLTDVVGGAFDMTAAAAPYAKYAALAL